MHRHLLLCFALTSSVLAQNFVFTDFTSVAGLSLNGTAAQSGTNLQITPAANNTAGTAWYSTPQPVISGFDCYFNFRAITTSTAADGFTFAIHSAPQGTAALGLAGGALGYGGLNTLANSLVVEFDSYANGDFGETVGNRISIHTNGAGLNSPFESFSIGETAAGVVLANNTTHQVRIEYIPGILNVYLNNFVTPLLSVNYDLVYGGTLLAGIPVGGLNLPTGEAIVGFTGGCGGLNQNTLIESWTWASSPVNVFTLAMSQPFGAGSVQLAVTNGTPGARYFTAVTFDPANGTSPSTGWWGGLHIALPDLFIQFNTNSAPFVGNLDSFGSALFTAPAGTLIPGLPTVYGVTRMLNPGQSAITGTTPVTFITLL